MKKIFNKEAILSLSVAIALSLVIVNISLADTCVSDGKSDSYGTYSESGERCSSCGKNCNWSFENGKLTISAKDGAKNVEPRDLSHGYQPWFDKLQEITNVEVKEGITRIGNSSFTASSLTSISLPSTLKSIGNAAFRETSNLTSIDIPQSVTSIERNAFYRATALTSITIPDSVTEIGHETFTGASSLNHVDLPESLKSIGVRAFYGTTLTEVELPEGLTKIDNQAFQGVPLTSITIPESVTSIGESAFWETRSLTSISIPDSVTEIGKFVFSFSALNELVIPDSWADNEQLNLDNELFGNYFSGSVKIICQGNINKCNKALEKFFPENDCPSRLTCNCETSCISPSRVQSITEENQELCSGSYIYENNSCHKRNESQCNRTDGYYYNGSSCVHRPKNGKITCGNSHKVNDGYCDRIRYTPAEAAEVLRDDNTNEVTITFKK